MRNLPIRILLLIALAEMMACTSVPHGATKSPFGSVSYQTAPVADGKHSVLRCKSSSTNFCYFKIGADGQEDQMTYKLAQSEELLIETPRWMTPMCVSYSPSSLNTCKGMHFPVNKDVSTTMRIEPEKRKNIEGKDTK